MRIIFGLAFVFFFFTAFSQGETKISWLQIDSIPVVESAIAPDDPTVYWMRSHPNAPDAFELLQKGFFRDWTVFGYYDAVSGLSDYTLTQCLCTGQSNAVVSTAFYLEEYERRIVWSGSEGSLPYTYSATDPQAKKYSICLGAALAILEKNKKMTGHPGLIRLVHHAQGGRPVEEWQEDGARDVFLQQLVTDETFDVIFWAQGEENDDYVPADYKSELDSVRTLYAERGWIDRNTKFLAFMPSIKGGNSEAWELLRYLNIDGNNNTGAINIAGAPLNDPIHYDTLGKIFMGEALANAYFNWQDPPPRFFEYNPRKNIFKLSRYGDEQWNYTDLSQNVFLWQYEPISTKLDSIRLTDVNVFGARNFGNLIRFSERFLAEGYDICQSCEEVDASTLRGDNVAAGIFDINASNISGFSAASDNGTGDLTVNGTNVNGNFALQNARYKDFVSAYGNFAGRNNIHEKSNFFGDDASVSQSFTQGFSPYISIIEGNGELDFSMPTNAANVMIAKDTIWDEGFGNDINYVGMQNERFAYFDNNQLKQAPLAILNGNISLLGAGFDAQNQKLSNVGSPTAAGDAVNLQYFQNNLPETGEIADVYAGFRISTLSPVNDFDWDTITTFSDRRIATGAGVKNGPPGVASAYSYTVRRQTNGNLRVIAYGFTNNEIWTKNKIGNNWADWAAVTNQVGSLNFKIYNIDTLACNPQNWGLLPTLVHASSTGIPPGAGAGWYKITGRYSQLATKEIYEEYNSHRSWVRWRASCTTIADWEPHHLSKLGDISDLSADNRVISGVEGVTFEDTNGDGMTTTMGEIGATGNFILGLHQLRADPTELLTLENADEMIATKKDLLQNVTGTEIPTNEFFEGERIYKLHVNLGSIPNGSTPTLSGLTLPVNNLRSLIVKCESPSGLQKTGHGRVFFGYGVNFNTAGAHLTASNQLEVRNESGETQIMSAVIEYTK